MKKLTINTINLLGMLSNYLSLKYNKTIQVKVEKDIEYIGYWEEKKTKITLYYEEEIELLGYIAINKVNLSEEELKEILDDMLANQNCHVQDIIYEAEINDISNNCFTYEDSILFEGVELILIENQKQLKKR